MLSVLTVRGEDTVLSVLTVRGEGTVLSVLTERGGAQCCQYSLRGKGHSVVSTL